jgi:type II secretory ATPase GspE/PulE/Tfp pilus assembly ATPase PilB-like protein
MGIEPFLLCSSVIAVIGQRLIRRICAKCREPYALAAETAEKMGLVMRSSPEPIPLFRGKGCSQCLNTGYAGRIVISEVLALTAKVKEQILARTGELKIKEAGRRDGMITMREDGMNKAFAGLTTLEEILRVTAPDEDLS